MRATGTPLWCWGSDFHPRRNFLGGETRGHGSQWLGLFIIITPPSEAEKRGRARRGSQPAGVSRKVGTASRATGEVTLNLGRIYSERERKTGESSHQKLAGEKRDARWAGGVGNRGSSAEVS